MDKKLKLEDLKIGMRVKDTQLEEIYDTYIILKDAKTLKDGNTLGTIAFIGKSNS